MPAWRSELSVPGSSWRKIEKGLASAADVIMLDLEDAVAPAEKPAARRQVIRALTELDWGERPRCYRVNGLDTPFFYRDLIDVVEAAGARLDRIVLPKVSRPEDVYVVATLLRQLELHLGRTEPIALEVQIETAAGALNAALIAAATERIAALTFGLGDYAASIRMPMATIGGSDAWDSVYPGHRMHYAMQQILVAARAAGRLAIDGPFADFRDAAGFRLACQRARALGYDGKWCIHPGQIVIVNEVFTPTPEEIGWARQVIATYEAATAAGQGAIALDQTMIDRASIRMAQATLAQAGERPHPATSRPPAPIFESGDE